MATAPIETKAYDVIPISARNAAEPREHLLVEYFRVLLRRRWLVISLALGGAICGFLFTVSALPVFRARTSLDIQNLNSDFMNMRAVAPTGESGGASTEAYIQTQIKLLQSDTLLERVVRVMKAEEHQPFIQRDDLLSQWGRTFHLTKNNPIPYDAVLQDAAKRVRIKPLGLTRLVEVTCDSWNAAFSAQFCNTLTAEFQAQDREVRWNEAQKTSEWLSRQVADVRVKLEQSEKRLEDATGGDGLVFSQENNSVSEDRLRQMQAELLRAQADRMAKEAQYEISKSAPAESLPSVLDSGASRDYQMKLTDLRRQVAELVPPLTEDHPKVVHLRSQIRELESSLTRERTTMITRMKNEYDAARNREGLLSGAYSNEERKVSSELGRTSQVNMLRREVESSQQLYQTLLQRVKEAGFASAMQITTIRIVDEAKPPKIAIAPLRSSAIGIGLLLGSLFGVGLAFFRERTEEVFRAPGEIQRYLHLRELGVIPTARVSRKGFQSTLATRPPTLLVTESVRPAPARPERSFELASWDERSSLIAEAYRNATYSILLANKEVERAKVYVITSPNVGEGKTTVVSNLGVALSQSKRRVVLVEGDLRKPRLHKIFNVGDGAGLRDVLRGDLDVAASPTESFCKPTAIPNLSVVPCGTGNEEVIGLLHSPQIVSLLARLSREFDLVLIDSPPMLHMADARILAGYSNGVILVLRARVTSRDAAESARDLFDHDRVRLVGTILNDFDPSRDGKANYYQSYYRYTRQTDSKEGVTVRS